MFIRFLTHDGRGLFQAAYDLLDSEDLPERDWLALRELLDWFRDELPAPPVGIYALYRNARTWFLDNESALDHMAQATLLAQLIERHEPPLLVVRRKRLGCIVHQDRFQAVAQSDWVFPTSSPPKPKHWKSRRDRSTIRRVASTRRH